MSLPTEGEREMPQLCAAAALMNMGPEVRALVPAEIVQRVAQREARLEAGFFDSHVDETKPKPKQEKQETAAPAW
jgi:hypothetical protein